MSYDLLFLLNKNRRKENLKITYNVTPPKHYLFSLHCYSSNALIYLNNRKKTIIIIIILNGSVQIYDAINLINLNL